MSDRLRFFLVGILAAAAVWVWTGGVLAQDEPAPQDPPAVEGPRASPRALYGTFLQAVNDERVRKIEGRLDDAVECLDLEGLGDLAAGDRARQLAIDLKAVLDFHGKIDVQDLPGPERAEGLFVLTTDEGPVIAHRKGDEWLFHPDTLRRAKKMRAAFEARGVERYQIQSLRAHVPESLRTRRFLFEDWQWIGLVALVLACWLAKLIVTFISDKVVVGVLRAKEWLPRALVAAEAAARPLGLFAVAGVIAVLHPFLDLPQIPWWVISRVFVVLGVVMLLYRLADVVAERMRERAERTESKLDDQLVPLVRTGLRIVVLVGGTVFVLENFGVEIGTLIAGLGVASLGVALAAKDTFANLLGSITVFLDQPFQVGDAIKIGAVEGEVEEVGFRSTRVRTFYNSQISIPNAEFVAQPIDNMGRREFRRFRTTVGILYGTPPEKIEAFCKGIREIVLANPHMKHENPQAFLHEFGPSSLDIMVNVFFNVPDRMTELRARQAFMLEVIRLAESLGVGFAYPSQSLYVESTPERPMSPPEQQSIDELDSIMRRFAKGGSDSRPEGTRQWDDDSQD